MNSEKNNDSNVPGLQSISQADFVDHIEDNDFFLAYGNPLIINCEDGNRLVAIAWPLAEKMLRAAGRGEEADEIIERTDAMVNDEEIISAEEKDIKYWMYEFEMTYVVKTKIDAYCTLYELTEDEFFEEVVTNCLNMAKSDPEGFKERIGDMKKDDDSDQAIKLVRYYPVYKGETEAQALKRKKAEEASNGQKTTTC